LTVVGIFVILPDTICCLIAATFAAIPPASSARLSDAHAADVQTVDGVRAALELPGLRVADRVVDGNEASEVF
jgi:hypothetical protein